MAIAAPTRVFVVCALLAAADNAAFVYVAERNAIGAAIFLRMLTGAFLAGTYPTGMKILAGWFKQGRGLALGIMVGALAVGSAAPHGVNALGGIRWQTVVLASSAMAVVAALIAAFGVSEGPYAAAQPPFDYRKIGDTFRNRKLRLANLGYLGHMWELYAMWTWMAVFIAASEHARRAADADVTGLAALVTFAVIGSGAIGCWLGGKYADRWGRTLVTSTAMVVSGTCASVVGLLFGATLVALIPLLLVWGISAVADSAQFSAAVSELAPREYVGTALTLQTSLGFLLTCATIYMLPKVAAAIGWRWSMSVLAIGPALGVWAMLALRRRPEALRLAGGAR